MEYVLAKILLPILVPMFIGLAKTLAERAATGVVAKVPKVLWPALAATLSSVAALVRPDLFLFADLPGEVSAALYSVASVGVREFTEKIARSMGMMMPKDEPLPVAPPTTVDQATRQVAVRVLARHGSVTPQAILDMQNNAAFINIGISAEEAERVLKDVELKGM
jgi:hypothetical protein